LSPIPFYRRLAFSLTQTADKLCNTRALMLQKQCLQIPKILRRSGTTDGFSKVGEVTQQLQK
jgi:hypothetical protein